MWRISSSLGPLNDEKTPEITAPSPLTNSTLLDRSVHRPVPMLVRSTVCPLSMVV